MKNIFFVVSILCPFCLYAQTDDFHAAYDSFKNQARKDYEDFRQRANAEYAEWVKRAWKEHKAIPVVAQPKEENVPPVVIKEEDKQKNIEDKSVVVAEEIKAPDPKPQPKPIAPIKEVLTSRTEKVFAFSFYGTSMKVRINEGIRFKLNHLDQNIISETWERLSSNTCDNLIRDCLELRIRHRLCDWAYLRMLDVMAQEFLGKGTNEAELLKAFIYCQSGYQMRLAFDADRLLMLYACEFSIFEKPCWEIGGTSYYCDNTSAQKISICEAAFPQEKPLSLIQADGINVAETLSEPRTLQNKDVDWMTATISINKNLLSFYNDYPSAYFGDDFMTRWAMYANMPMSVQVKNELYPQLMTWIKGKTNFQAVDNLCFWIQAAFPYEYDDKVWGGDRAFFADETLYYPYCDCEDRSILLTRLVRDLLGLKCALVYYPGHLATAIAVGEDAKGDHIRIDGIKYLICDPTYIGAPIGITMPGMDNKTAKVIVLK